MIDFLNVTTTALVQMVAESILLTALIFLLWKAGYLIYRYGLYVVAFILSVMIFVLTKILKVLKFAGRKIVKVADNLPTLEAK